MFQRIKHLFGTSDADTEADGDADADDPSPFADPPPLDDLSEGDARDADGDAAGSPAGSDADDRETLATRVDDLEEDLESTAASLRGVEGAQSDLEDSVDEMHQTVRRLAGVYDRVAAAENPFVDGSLERTPGDTDAPDAVDTAAGTGVDIASDAERGVTADGAGDSVVSFDDLRDDAGDADDGTADTDVGDGVASPSFGGPDDPGADAHAGTSRGETRTHDVAGGETRARGVGEDEMPVVSSLPGGYAGDVLVMEWLSVLMERSGPAGALRAISHYEAVGWISADVEATLLDIVGGPGLDVFVDPTRPREPSADEHALSYDYLRALRHLREN
ncbi:FlaD/FlaE family flagellar protein [Halarchaeum nitratireducens]|uniref:Archaeal flagella protein FlaD/E domain-containing protein n=1 Tax=Halarchaeum nitratireducens TaxID=489913 RepID=A0A830GCL8_9EURY|nr:FlaD/FlaE family flagellar protein [Halarchaeum nitratireducens]GGN20681.1 hypothetical protein GCM10009021_22270 [Halarchaeum nitratireducens]